MGKYRMDSAAVQALHEHYKDHRKDVRRCSDRQRQDAASVLNSLVDGAVQVNHRTSTGLFVHVELDSSMTVVRLLDQDETAPVSFLVEGSVALRRRILEKHGLLLVTVREGDWRELDEARDKRRHLRSLLSTLSDVLE